jgi:hypothetical protein
VSTETVQIIVTEQGAEQAAQNIRGVGQASQQADQNVGGLNNALGQLKTALAAVGLGLGISQVLELSESYGIMVNKLRLTSSSVAELAAREEALFDIAQRTRQGLEGIAARSPPSTRSRRTLT